MSVVRILFLSQLLPWPLDAGPKVRSHYVLRYLAAAGHDITAVCFVRPSDRPADSEGVRPYCRQLETVPIVRSRVDDVRHGLMSLVSSTPFLIRRDRSPAMRATIQRVMAGRSFDAVHADQLWMAPYAAAHGGGPMTVLDQHNAVFKVPERLAEGLANPVARALARQESRKLERFEQTVIDTFDRVVWVSRADRDAFRSTGDTRLQPVIPIGVDPVAQARITRPNPFRVTFVGGLHWPPNAEGVEWFLRRCWGTVTSAAPSAVLTVVGQGAPRSLTRLAAQRGVELAGYVPDLARILSETAVCIVPLQAGAGMRVKILEAWCWGVPIVSTTVGAEGLAATPGEELLVADDGPEFARATIEALTDRGLSARLSEAGRAFVERAYDWRRIYPAWAAVYPS